MFRHFHKPQPSPYNQTHLSQPLAVSAPTDCIHRTLEGKGTPTHFPFEPQDEWLSGTFVIAGVLLFLIGNRLPSDCLEIVLGSLSQHMAGFWPSTPIKNLEELRTSRPLAKQCYLGCGLWIERGGAKAPAAALLLPSC